MVKIMVLYGPPKDPTAFEDEYATRFRSVVASCHQVRLAEPAKVLHTLDGTEPPYYRIGELWFADLDEARAFVDAPEGRTWRDELTKLATGGVTLLLTDTDTE